MPSDNSKTVSGKTRREEFKEVRRKRRQQQRITTVLVIVGAALVLIGLLALPTIQAEFAPVGEIKTAAANPRPQAQDNGMGDPNAPVKIEEFSDYQCPYCRNFANDTQGQIVEAYVKTGKVYFVYRSMGNWISDNIGQGKTESRDAAEAAYCAGEQNKYWEYHDLLFANWTGEDVGSFTNKRLLAFGEKLSLDMNAFRDCVSGNKFETRANQDRVDGERYGISGTPSFVINGKLAIEGAQPFAKFQQVIDEALAGR